MSTSSTPEPHGPTAAGTGDQDPARASDRPPSGSQTPGRWGFFTGRSGLVIPLLLAAFATYLVVGNLTMSIPKGADFPGPTFFPWFLAAVAYVLAALLVVHYLRHPEVPAETSGRTYTTFSDWRAIAWCVGGFAAFAALLEVLGWVLAAGLLFWCVARGIGSRRAVFDLVLGLVVSSLIYLTFGIGLGLPLPSGVFGLFAGGN